ncbi:MAG: MFS transporter [Pseudomonadota bacterium]|nr:MFS transporter [Polaromonas sp.]MDO8717761.1 MFS transporter [Polaromonas sp.]
MKERHSPERTPWLAVAAALATGVLAATYIGKLAPALPSLVHEFGLSRLTAGWVVSIISVLGAACGLVAGLLAGRLSAFRFTLAGCGALACGAVLGVLADGSAWLLASRVLEGAGFLAVTVAAPALIFAAAVPADRKLALGVWGVYMACGMALVVLFAPLVLAVAHWRALWLAIATLTGASALALWLLRGHFPQPSAAPPTFAEIAGGLRHAGAWWTAVAMMFYAGQWTAVMIWLPTFLVERRSASLVVAAALTALVIAMNAPGNLAGTWLQRRNARRGTLISAGALAIALCSVGIFSDGAPDGLRYASCLALSFFGSLIPAAAMTAPQAYARSPSQVATIQGLVQQLSSVGMLCGPPAMAALVAATGQWERVLPVLVLAAAAAFVCGLMVNRNENRVEPLP